MRQAITLGFPHGGGNSVLILGTAVPIHVQRAKLKERLARGSDPDFERVEIWTSTGAVRKRFRTPAEAAARVAANLPPAADESSEDEVPEETKPEETKRKRK